MIEKLQTFLLARFDRMIWNAYVRQEKRMDGAARAALDPHAKSNWAGTRGRA